MIALCIEASHQRGLGHLFKAIAFGNYLKSVGEQFLILVNDDHAAGLLLKKHSLPYECVNLNDHVSNWEKKVVSKFGITTWINDRLDTDILHSENVKHCGIKLVTIDDRGTGAALADIHFAPLLFKGKEQLQGHRVLTGPQFLILNPEIDIYKRIRTSENSILVSLGGSDTYGVTLRVIELLKTMGKTATIIAGPAFLHFRELMEIADGQFAIKRGVPSLIAEFDLHDLAITGGGMTPFEANASGLPCIVIANELHEVEIGHYLQGIGSSVFAGYHEDLNSIDIVDVNDIKRMSSIGIEAFSTHGVANIFQAIVNE